MDKFFLKTLGLFAFAGASLFAGFEPGGVTFDFGKYPVRKARKAEGVNLLSNSGFSNPGTDLQGEGQTNGKRKGQFWDGCSYVHMAATDGDSKPFRKELWKYARRFVEDGYATILTPPEAARTWKERLRISNRVRQTVNVPYSEKPSSYQLSFKLRGRSGKVDTWNHAQIFVFARANRLGERNKDIGCCVNRTISHSADFQEHIIKFNLPAKSRSATVDFALYGVGKMQFDDVKLTPTTLSSAVEALNFPCGYFDEIFCVGENRCAPMLFALGCEGRPQRKGLFFELELPEGFRVADTRHDHPLVRQQKNTYTFSLERISPAAIAPAFNHQWQAVSILISSDKKAGSQFYTARYRTRGEDYATAWRTLKLQVIPTVSGKRPSTYLSGAMFSTDFNYRKEAAQAVRLLAEAGFSAGVNGHAQVIQALKQYNMRRLSGAGLANGFWVIPGKLQENEKFRKFDGSAWPGACCPGAVINRSASYRKNFLPAMEKLLVSKDEADAVMSNWEPYMFDFRGCFCADCMKEFAKFAHIPLKEATPQLAISKYQPQWVRFRSMRHGELVKTIAADIAAIGAKAGKKTATFIPEMAYTSVLPNRMKGSAQYAVSDYISSIPELNLWGPYIYHAPDRPYLYQPGPNLRTYTAAEQVLAGVKALTKKRPKLYAFPHGTLDNPVWFSDPQGIGFEFLCFFVQGWEGSFGYYFPRGGDARYYKALAEANTLIADHETIRRRGKEITSAVTLVPVTPFPKENFFEEFPGIPSELPGLSKKSLLQFRAFQHKETRLVMAGNFWISGEVFYTLKVKNLPAAQKFSVTVPGINCGIFTGAELAKGILMQTGALRWQFITIKPASQNSGAVFTQTKLKSLMKRRLPQITAAAKMTAAEYRKHRARVDADFGSGDLSAVKAVSNQGLSLSVQGQFLTVKAPSYTLQIEPRQGGRIFNWKTGNTVLVADPAPRGLGIDGFWYPAAAAKQLLWPYNVTGTSRTADGIAVDLEMTIMPRQIPLLAGLRVNKRYEFTKDGVKIATTLSNHSVNGMNFAFRFHSMPDFLALHKGQSGTIDFGNKVQFKREFFEKMFRFAPADPEIEKAFNMHKLLTISRPSAVIQAPWSPVKLSMEFSPTQLQCFVCWDDGKDSSATFEPVFRRTPLAPGEKVTYTQTCRILR